MTDLSTTIEPKSDQLNADDLISGPRTIRITKLSVNLSSPDQPVSVHFEGDNGKPYKPCKSMRRVLVHCWGADGSKFSGRAMTIYRDPKVKFGGFETGGVRISHLTDIKGRTTMALTATKASRKPFTVDPLVAPIQKHDPMPSPSTLDKARSAARGGSDVMATWWKGASADERASANTIKAELTELRSAADAALATGETLDENPEPGFSAADAYESGRLAREDNDPRGIPGDLEIRLHDAWFAGWDDRDAEIQSAAKGK